MINLTLLGSSQGCLCLNDAGRLFMNGLPKCFIQYLRFETRKLRYVNTLSVELDSKNHCIPIVNQYLGFEPNKLLYANGLSKISGSSQVNICIPNSLIARIVGSNQGHLCIVTLFAQTSFRYRYSSTNLLSSNHGLVNFVVLETRAL